MVRGQIAALAVLLAAALTSPSFSASTGEEHEGRLAHDRLGVVRGQRRDRGGADGSFLCRGQFDHHFAEVLAHDGGHSLAGASPCRPQVGLFTRTGLHMPEQPLSLVPQLCLQLACRFQGPLLEHPDGFGGDLGWRAEGHGQEGGHILPFHGWKEGELDPAASHGSQCQKQYRDKRRDGDVAPAHGEFQ